MGNMQDTKKKLQFSWEVSLMGNPEILRNIKSVKNNKEKNLVILSITSFPTTVQDEP